jgi:aspartate aminotransferase-like enzyme
VDCRNRLGADFQSRDRRNASQEGSDRVSAAGETPLLLMTPGPTRVPDRVLRAGARPMIHHRTREFSAELATVIELLKPVFGTASRVLPVHTTGRGALEAAVCNFFSPGDEIAVCCNGKFGELWAGLAESYGIVVHRICTDWTRAVDVTEIASALDAHARIRAVAFTYSDTSTGVSNNVADIARTVRLVRPGALVLADGVSSIGGMPFAFDDWDVDFAATASQKCLMSSPGLSFAALSNRAWSATKTSKLPRNYFDFAAIRTEVSKEFPETPGTPPVDIVLQIAEALRLMHEEGLTRVYERHELMAARARAGAKALGLALQCPGLAAFSSTLTAIAVPDGISPKDIRDGIRARGILTAGGLGKYKDSSFRIGHMGDIRVADVDRTLTALAETLAELNVAR